MKTPSHTGHNFPTLTSGQDVRLIANFLAERNAELNWSTDLYSWRHDVMRRNERKVKVSCHHESNPGFWLEIRWLSLPLWEHWSCQLLASYFCLLTSIISMEASRPTSWQGWDLGTRLHLHLRRVTSFRQATVKICWQPEGGGPKVLQYTKEAVCEEVQLTSEGRHHLQLVHKEAHDKS